MANDKVITTQALIDKFEMALADAWGYIWGTSGGVWTQAQQDAATREQTKKYGQRWVGRHVADCSGLFSWAFKQLGSYMYHGSDTMFRKYTTSSGELEKGRRKDGQDLKPGTAVFTWKPADKKYGHVGLYIGNGNVIEAYGTQKGVIRSKVTETRWTHWGELKNVDYSGAAPDPGPGPEDKPTIKRGSSGAYVTECQQDLMRLGYDVGKTGADGKFGANTEKAVKAFQKDHDGPDGKALKVDGIVGQATWWALDAAVGPEPQPTKRYSVIVHNLTLSQAEKITASYPDSEITEEVG